MLPPYGLVTPRLIAAFIVLLGNGSNHPYTLYGTFVVFSFLHLLTFTTFANVLLQRLCAGSLLVKYSRWSWRGFYSTSVMPSGIFTQAPFSFLYSARMYFFVSVGW